MECLLTTWQTIVDASLDGAHSCDSWKNASIFSSTLTCCSTSFFGGKTPCWICNTLPLLLKPDGNGSFPKRDGDKLGFHFIQSMEEIRKWRAAAGFREQGTYQNAFLNFLAFLGSESGAASKRFSSMEELIEAFSIERNWEVSNKFEHCLRQMGNNEQYIRAIVHCDLADFLNCWCSRQQTPSINGKAKTIISLLKERRYVSFEIWLQGKKIYHTSTGGLFWMTTLLQEMESRRGKVLTAYAQSLETLQLDHLNSTACEK